MHLFISLVIQAFKYLYQKSVVELLEGPQFLHILAAEAEHLVTVFITLPDEAKASFERRLQEAFSSDSYSDNAKAWNAERMRVVSEAIEQHLIPVGAKWTREWLREEVEDLVAWRCAETLREVRVLALSVGLFLIAPAAYRCGPLQSGKPPTRGDTIGFSNVLGQRRPSQRRHLHRVP